MELAPGRTAAVAFLCAAAAAVALWCGPLAAATGALHSSPVPVHATAQTHAVGSHSGK